MGAPPPIVVVCDGDVSIYQNAETAERSLEPVDVRSGRVTVYDSRGRRLRLRLDPPGAGRARPLFWGVSTVSDGRVLIQDEGDSSDAPRHELRDLVLAYLRAAQIGVPPELESLEDVLNMAIEKLGYESA